MIRLDQITLREIHLPLREPFRISSGTVSQRRICLLELHDASGAIAWSEAAGGPLYIVHMSTGEAATLVRRARQRGAPVLGETCPHYLVLTDAVFSREDGHLFATCPQIKKRKDGERLWQGLQDGEIAVAATESGVDPIGSCVGQKGTRVQAVINELGGEKIDIIEWSEDPAKFIAFALAPAKVIGVETNKDLKVAQVDVPEDRLRVLEGPVREHHRVVPVVGEGLAGHRVDFLAVAEGLAFLVAD